MRRSKIKTIIDILFIVLELICIIIFSLVDNKMITIISIVLFFSIMLIRYLIDLFIWRCPKCGCHLPTRLFRQSVFNCPYCGADLYENDI